MAMPFDQLKRGLGSGLLVLIDSDGEPLWEIGAIVRYLAAGYGSAAFWPADPEARARVEKWKLANSLALFNLAPVT